MVVAKPKLRPGMRMSAADTLTTPLLPDLSIPLADVFHHRRRPPRDE